MTAPSLARKLARLEAAAARARPCPACGGRAWRLKLYGELDGGGLIDEPGFEGQAGEPGPCPLCAPEGVIACIIACRAGGRAVGPEGQA